MNRLAVSLALSRRGRPEELLLVERSPRLRYFGGFLAFPGGTLDPEDEEITIANLDDPALAPFVAAGARELFEETGVWLGRGGTAPSRSQLVTDRKRLLAGDTSLRALLERHRQHLDARDLEPLCRITTPPFAPVRYDTWFLRGLLPEDVTIDIWDGELVDGDFVDPAKTVTRWRRGEVAIAPPMVVLLDEWAKGQDGLYQRIRKLTESYRRGKLHRIYFSPGILLVPLKTPTRPPATHTNTCIVGEERMYVVDPSPVDPAEQERFFELLEDLLGEGRKLKAILLTHYHPDHVGALTGMQRRFDVGALAHVESIRRLPERRFDGTLEHGDELDLGTAPDGTRGWKLRAYHVPGHAPGHLAFQESRYQALLAGDLVSTISSILIDPQDGHLATYLRSLDFLESVADGTLYPGHGPPVPDGRKAIRKTLEHRKEREAQLLRALTGSPRTPAELVKAIYTDVDPSMHGLAERSLLSGLLKLQEEGKVLSTEAGYRLV